MWRYTNPASCTFLLLVCYPPLLELGIPYPFFRIQAKNLLSTALSVEAICSLQTLNYTKTVFGPEAPGPRYGSSRRPRIPSVIVVPYVYNTYYTFGKKIANFNEFYNA